MMTLYPMMSVKRKAEIQRVIQQWRYRPIRNRDKKTCPQGHPYTPENVYIHRIGGKRRGRVCRICAIARMSVAHRRRKAARAHAQLRLVP